MMSETIELNNNPRLDRIVAAGKELFYRYGIKRVTVEEICEKAEISKMTFYKFFANKLELVKYLVNQLFDVAESAFDALITGNLPFAAKVKKIIEIKLDNMRDMSSEFIVELYKGEYAEIIDLMQQRTAATRKKVVDFIQTAIAEGHIRADVPIEFHLYMHDKLTEMALDPKLTAQYDSPAAAVNELVNFYFYGILKR